MTKTLALAALLAVWPAHSFAASSGPPAASGSAAASTPASRSTTIALPDTLTLAWLEPQALARNPGYAAMRAAADQAAASARATGALTDPDVLMMGAPASFGSGPPGAGYRVEITQSLTPFGQRGLERRAASAEAGAAIQDAEGARLALLRETREAFFDYYLVLRSVESNALQSDLMGQFRRVALARYSAGTGEEQDPLSADLEIAELDHRAARLEAERRVATARLNALLHLDARAPLPPAPSTLEAPVAADTSRDSIAARGGWPALAAADARLAAAESRLALASRERLPRLQVGWSYDRAMAEPAWRSMGIVGLNLPIWLGRLGDAEDEARAGVARAQDQRTAAADEASRAVAEASADFAESSHEVEVIERHMVPTSARALTATRASFEGGRGSFLALLEVARRAADTRLELEMARVRRARAWAALQSAVAADRVPIQPGVKP